MEHEAFHKSLTYFTICRIYVEFFLSKCIIPYVAHVLPVSNHTVLHWIVDFEHRPQFGGLVAHHQIFDLNVVDSVGSSDDRSEREYKNL